MKLPAFSDIRLGWLQRLCSVARHQNLVRVGEECYVDATSASDSIQRLEFALRRPLVAPTTARLTAVGKSFISTADRILNIADISTRPMTNVSVGWFQSLIAISQHESYVAAGKSLGWTRDKVMRGVSGLEDWIGEPLVVFKGVIRLTPKGEDVAVIAREIILLLESFREPNTHPVHWTKMKPRKKPWWLRTFGVAPKSRRKVNGI